MAGEKVTIDLNLKGEKQAQRGLKDTGEAAKKAGDGLKGMAEDAGFLDKRVGELRGELRELIKDFDKTGDKDVLKSIRKANREVGQLNRLKKQFAELGGESGTEFAAKFSKTATAGIASSFGSLKKPALIGGLVGLAALAAPLIGATIQAAVLGGVGGAGIIGGLALAARDSRVQDAASKLGETAMSAFGRAAEPFIAPAVSAIGILGEAAGDISGDMRQAFATIAPVLTPLVRGITSLVRHVMPGFLEAMEGAKPIIRALANDMPMLGDAISEFFSQVSEDPEGAIRAVHLLLRTLSATIVTAGILIKHLSKLFEGITEGAEAAGGAIDSMFGTISMPSGASPVGGLQGFATLVRGLGSDTEKATDSSFDFAGGLDDVADSASKAEQELVELKTAMDEAFGRTMDIQEATIRYEETWDRAIEVLKEGKRTLDAASEAGRENRGAILDQIQAIKDIRQANIDNNVTVDDANAIYDKQIEQLRKTAINLGFNKQQVNDLINAFDSLPQDIELELRVKGLRGTLEQMRELTRLLGSRAAAAAALGAGQGTFGQGGGTSLGGRASGGPVLAGQAYVVGENGPEVLQMGGASGFVHNASQTRAMLSGGSMAAVAPIVVFRASDRAVQALIDMLDFRIEHAMDREAALVAGGPR